MKKNAFPCCFGPCIICGRSDYFTVGRLFQGSGFPVNCYGGRGVINFRVYPGGLGDLLEGWIGKWGL